MKKRFVSAQSGMSLLEVMIVIVIVSVLAAVSIMQFGKSKTNLQRQNIARELKVFLERARFDSVKRRAEDDNTLARVTINSPTSFSLSTDLNGNGVIDSSDAQAVDFSSNDISILGSNLVFPVTIKFDWRGQITAKNNNGDAITPVFTVCGDNCTLQTADSTNSNVISISQTGTVAMAAGGESQTVFQNPSVTAVDACSQINPLVEVGNSTGCNITSTPAPTANPNPTATPTPSASPTATPVPTPSPTPSNYCTTNQKPSSTGCTCKAPMIVHTNGKCY